MFITYCTNRLADEKRNILTGEFLKDKHVLYVNMILEFNVHDIMRKDLNSLPCS